MPLNYTTALLTISTLHFDRLVEFYHHLIEQEPTNLLPNVYAEFQLSGIKLGIFQPKVEDQEETARDKNEEDERRTGRSREEERTGVRHSAVSPIPTPPSSHVPTPTGMSLCLEVANLEAAIAHLTQLGYPPPGEILVASHGREIYAYDPDGNWLILHQSNL